MVAAAQALTFAQTTPFTVAGWRDVHIPGCDDVVDPEASSLLDARSVSLRDRLQADWDERVRQLRPSEREAWLRTQEAYVAFGVGRCREMLASIARVRADLKESVVSLPWLVAWERRNELSPSYSTDHQCDRRHSAKMVLSEGYTAVGDGPRRRRFTPPQAVAEEDLFDLMGEDEALFCRLPTSSSAVYINRWREKNAPPDASRW